MSEEKEDMMSAVLLETYSNETSIAFSFSTRVERPPPVKNHGVLVEAYYCASNPIDYKIGTGAYKMLLRRALPRVPCFDCAGIVVAVGPKCTRIAVGDRVVGDTGNFGQRAAGAFVPFAHEQDLAKVPQHVLLKDIAGLPLAGLTSFQALKAARVGPKSVVVIRGASGGTGTLAVQFARAMGAEQVIAISSAVELCQELGATEVINYKVAKWEEVLKDRGVDCFYDCVGGYDAWAACKAGIVKSSGYYVTITGDRPGENISLGRIITNFASTSNRRFWSTFGSCGYIDHIRNTGVAGDLQQMVDWVADGRVRVVLDEQSPFPFSKEGAHAMFARQHSGRARGKLVMEIKAEEIEEDEPVSPRRKKVKRKVKKDAT